MTEQEEEEEAFFDAITHVKPRPAGTVEDAKNFIKVLNKLLFDLELTENQETYNF
jgi:hypothetical protein